MADIGNDIYKTISGPAEASYKNRGSKFLAFAFHVTAIEEVKGIVEGLRKKYYDATHHCYAFRIGPEGDVSRVNDDGEPSGTAGRPILGQMLSISITDCLVVVIRYFGGTKLGVPGLINAYRMSAAAALEAAAIVEKTVDTIFSVVFPYVSMNDVMSVVKEFQPLIVSQKFDNLCNLVLAVRLSRAGALEDKLRKIDGAGVEKKR